MPKDLHFIQDARRAGVILSEAKNLGSCRALACRSQRELAFEAKAQGLSLNQFIVHKLSRAVGQPFPRNLLGFGSNAIHFFESRLARFLVA